MVQEQALAEAHDTTLQGVRAFGNENK